MEFFSLPSILFKLLLIFTYRLSNFHFVYVSTSSVYWTRASSFASKLLRCLKTICTLAKTVRQSSGCLFIHGRQCHQLEQGHQVGLLLGPDKCQALFLCSLILYSADLFSSPQTGKGDLVGSDINVHLVATSNGQMTATTNSAGQDVVVRSSSDIKVRPHSIAPPPPLTMKSIGRFMDWVVQ